MAKKKTAKKTIVKAHSIADSIKESKGGRKVDNPYAVGMAAAKKAAVKRKAARRKG